MKAEFVRDEDNNDNPFEERINEFKNDSEKMEVLSDFIEDVIKTARGEAEQKQNENLQQSNTKDKPSVQSFTIGDLKNGKVINRARGLMVRLFDAICNCANTAAAPAQRMRRKRSSQAK